ncbi:putative AC9 transposase [Fusarium oxysporum f. sp. albedinis]|nr:putative AC9 transposase [Fusarium oxysporum f. sp. albedinis]
MHYPSGTQTLNKVDQNMYTDIGTLALLFAPQWERTSVLTNELLYDVQGKSGGMVQELQAIFLDSDASRISITPTVSRSCH